MAELMTENEDNAENDNDSEKNAKDDETDEFVNSNSTDEEDSGVLKHPAVVEDSVVVCTPRPSSNVVCDATSSQTTRVLNEYPHLCPL